MERWRCSAFAATGSYPIALALLFAAGFFELSFNAMAQTLVQLNAPLEIRGRVVGLFNMAALGLRAFSGLTVGLLGQSIGIHWSLGLSAALLVAFLFVLYRRAVKGELTEATLIADSETCAWSGRRLPWRLAADLPRAERMPRALAFAPYPFLRVLIAEPHRERPFDRQARTVERQRRRSDSVRGIGRHGEVTGILLVEQVLDRQ